MPIGETWTSAPVATIFATQSERIEEIINKNVDMILQGLNPIWRDNVWSSIGVGPADELGRDMNIIRVFQSGMTGVLEQANPREDFPIWGDNAGQNFGNRHHLMGLKNTFPDPTMGPNQKPYRMIVPMRAMVANIMFTLGELQAQATPALIGDIIAPKLTGFGQNMATQLQNYWYLSQNAHYQLGNCGAVSSGSTLLSGPDAWYAEGSPALYYIVIRPTNEAIDRFFIGQAVDIYKADGTIKRNGTASTGASRLILVDTVDEVTGEIRLVTNVNPETWIGWNMGTNAAAAGGDANHVHLTTDILVYRNSRGAGSGSGFTGIAGINSYLRFGNSTQDYILGAEGVQSSPSGSAAIDVNIYTEHKSLGFNLQGRAMTEHTMRKILRRFHAAKRRYGYDIDTIKSSEGVQLAYLKTQIGREHIDRTSAIGGKNPQGAASNSNFGMYSFTMDGKTYNWWTDTSIEDGTMYGIKLKGNWQKYSPPNVKGTKSFGNAPAGFPFQFVAPALTGGSSIQLPIYATGQAQGSGQSLQVTGVTEGAQMPGWMRMQIVPRQLCGLKVVNCATDKAWGEQDIVPINGA